MDDLGTQVRKMEVSSEFLRGALGTEYPVSFDEMRMLVDTREDPNGDSPFPNTNKYWDDRGLADRELALDAERTVPLYGRSESYRLDIDGNGPGQDGSGLPE
tara:strand:+ start:9887 stop:10192 length:306 start_codon:yes stop_codon:yes gene_type:complete